MWYSSTGYSETGCCQQSECDTLYRSNNKFENVIDVEYDSDNNYRCCDIIKTKPSPLPSDCKLCTICCDEVERKQIPLPIKLDLVAKYGLL